MINPCKTIFTLAEGDHKYLVCIDCSNHDEDWAYPLDVGFTAETGEMVFKCQVYGFDDADELQDDELLFSVGNIDAAYYDAVLLARKMYRESRLTPAQLKRKPIIVLPYSYSTTNDPECAKLLATAMSMTEEKAPDSEKPYTAVALNLTPKLDYIDDIDDSGEEDASEELSDFDEEYDNAEEINNNLKAYHKNALEAGFASIKNDPTEYSVSRYVIYWPNKHTIDTDIDVKQEQTPKSKRKNYGPKSLKCDHYPCEKITEYYYVDKIWEYRYVYNESCGIDCYHRLRLTKEDLKLLDKIGRLEKKSSLPSTSDNLAEKCATEAGDLWEKFYDQFYNPFNLDVEYEPWEDNRHQHIRFTFYDDDYCYYLTRISNRWEISCTEGWRGSDETEIEMDSV